MSTGEQEIVPLRPVKKEGENLEAWGLAKGVAPRR